MTPPVNALEAKGLIFSYGHNHSLDVSHMAVPSGTIMGLVGPNGSGKSTLLKILALLMRPQRGRVIFFGEEVSGREALIRGMGITLLPQRPLLLKRSVRSNLCYPLRGLPAGEMEDRCLMALDMVGLGESYLPKPWYRLSGGESQRVALAVRLAMRPRVLLLDEPISNADQVGARAVKDAILKARDLWGTSVLVSSHQPSWLSGLCDGFFVMRDGRLGGVYGLKDRGNSP